MDIHKNILIIIAIQLFLINCIYSQSDCIKAYYQYNPKYFSARTSSLILNNYSNCIESQNLVNSGGINKSYEALINPTLAGYTKADISAVKYVYRDQFLVDDKLRYYDGMLKSGNEQIFKPLQRLSEFSGLVSAATFKLPLISAGFAGVSAFSSFGSSYGLEIKNEADKTAIINILGQKYWEENINQDCGSDFQCVNNNLETWLTGLENIEIPLSGSNPTTINKVLSGLSENDKMNIINSDPNNAPSTPAASAAATQELIDRLNDVEQKDLQAKQEMMEAFANFTEQYEGALVGIQDVLASMNLDIEELKAISSQLLANDEIIFDKLDLHTELIGKNALEISILQEMMFGSLDANQQFNIMDNCINGKECPSNILALKKDGKFPDKFNENYLNLKKAIEFKKFANTVQNVTDGLRAGVNLALALGVEGEDAERLSEGLFYAESTLGLVTNLAAVWSGQGMPSSIFGAINSVTALINGPGSVKPSAEVQAIEALREEMNARFDRVEDMLTAINDNIIRLQEDLSEQLLINREIIQYQFNQQNEILIQVLTNQEIIKSDLGQLLTDDLGDCVTIFNLLVEDSQNSGNGIFENYQKYIDIYNVFGNDIEDCLEGISDALQDNFSNSNGGINYNYFRLQTNNEPYLINEDISFGRTYDFFNWFYSTRVQNLEKATDMLLLNQDVVFNSQKIYSLLKQDDNLDFEFSNGEVLNQINYIDTESFARFLNFYELFYPYFEIKKAGATFEPKLPDDIVSDSNNDIQNLILQRLINQSELLLKIGHTTEVQQNLMNGVMILEPMYRILYGDLLNANITIPINSNSSAPVNMPAKEVIINILRTNPTIATNFATFLIRKNYDFNITSHEYDIFFGIDGGTYYRPVPIAKEIFSQYAYDNQPFKINDIVLDSVYLDTTLNTRIDLDYVSTLSALDVIDFVEINDDLNEEEKSGFIRIAIEEGCQSENCQVLIAIPPLTVIESDKLQKRKQYYSSLKINRKINDIIANLQYNDGSLNTWEDLHTLKLTLTNIE